jgi:hypothetical protein
MTWLDRCKHPKSCLTPFSIVMMIWASGMALVPSVTEELSMFQNPVESKIQFIDASPCKANHDLV